MTTNLKNQESVLAPWKVGYVEEQKEFIILGPLDCIATVHMPDMEDASQQESIAHLIGAAPDLLSALRLALVQIKQDNDERRVPRRSRATEIQVRNAIAKAEGHQ